MPQYALPTSWNASGTWVEGAGDADGVAYDELDEGFGAGRGTGSGPDDLTTYWASVSNPSNQAIQTGLSAVTDPGVNTGHIYRSRSCKSASGGRQIDLVIELRTALDFSAGSLVASISYTNVDEVWTTRGETITTAEADLISTAEYGTMAIDTFANSVGGGAGRAGWESAHEFECPNVPGTPISTSRLRPRPFAP